MNNQLLLEFLKHWLNWVESGAPISDEDNAYQRYLGLCRAAENYALSQRMEYYLFGSILAARFSKDRLDGMYPFGRRNFHIAAETDTMHCCEVRLAWVRKTINELESELCVSQ